MIKKYYYSIKNVINNNKKIIIIFSILFTFIFAIYNRFIGIYKLSLWHEVIGIYYLSLAIIKFILFIYIIKSKRKKDSFIFYFVKVILIFLNMFLILPIYLMVINKRPVNISFILSIAIALYATIKIIKTIVQFVKVKKYNDILLNEYRSIDLMDALISILTLQNTLIAVNSNEFNIGMYYLTIVSSIVVFIVNSIIIIKIKGV